MAITARNLGIDATVNRATRLLREYGKMDGCTIDGKVYLMPTYSSSHFSIYGLFYSHDEISKEGVVSGNGTLWIRISQQGLTKHEWALDDSEMAIYDVERCLEVSKDGINTFDCVSKWRELLATEYNHLFSDKPPPSANTSNNAPVSVYPGYVYLLQSPTRAYKIGHTKDPGNRLKTFGVKLPFEVEYIALIETPDMKGFEKSLHAYFENKRINGEWFELTDEDVAYIKGLAK